MSPAPARVAIIGGGFSGAMVAVHLARRATIPVAIDIIEPRAMLGGGVAYSATDPAHRINVPASRMVVFDEDPLAFDRWMRERGVLETDPAALWEKDAAFPQRQVFGRYIAGLVAQAGREGVALRHHRARAMRISAGPGGYAVTLEDGAMLTAELVILAVSHPRPSLPAPLRAITSAGATLIADPWRPGALDAIPPEASVLIVGTGLTMADAVSTLDRRGHRGPITALSRRGLLSRGHVFGAVAKRNWFETAVPCRTALGLCRAVRAQVRAAGQEGQPWQAVFDDVRAQAARLWGALDLLERRRLVRHLRPFWDVHRFRVAPQAEHAIGRLRAAGQFRSLAAFLLGASWDGQRVKIELRPRGVRADGSVVLEADAVIVTTGPDHAGAIASNPALASLAAAGLIRPDPVGLGLDVDASDRAVGADGASRPGLLVVGPLARGPVGELMGLPQVSQHAAKVGATAAATLPALMKAAQLVACDAANNDDTAKPVPGPLAAR